MDGTYQSDLKCLAKNAMELAEQTGRLCGRLNRMVEEIDEEQRAEMYAILQAIGREASTEAAAYEGMMEDTRV